MKCALCSVRLVLALAVLLGCSGCFLAGPLYKETRHSVTPYVPNTGIRVQTTNGKIAVNRSTSGGDVSITATVRCVSEERLQQTVVTPQRGSDGVLHVEVAWPNGKRKNREGCDLVIETPGAEGVELRSSNGSITLADLSGLAKLRTSNGSIKVDRHAGPVEAKTSNGKVSLQGAQGSAKLESTNGTINASDVAGALDAESSNGSLELSLGRGSSGPVRAKTSNGSVKLGVGGLTGTLELRTSNGKIRVGDGVPGQIMQQSKREAVLQLGGQSAPTSTIRTSNGSITVNSG